MADIGSTLSKYTSSAELSALLESDKFSIVSVKTYGAVGDGITIETSLIQDALDVAGNIYFPKGTYLVDIDASNICLYVKSNTNIYFHPEAIIKIKPQSSDTYRILYFNNVENIKIEGGQLVGDRDEHIGTTGELGHAIFITGSSSNISIDKMILKDCWGDGCYIGQPDQASLDLVYCNDITINSCTIDNNRRQGISITGGKEIWITNNIIKNTNGTLPEDGIDIEPNDYNSCDSIFVQGNTIYNNDGMGIELSIIENAIGTSFIRNIVISGNTVYNNTTNGIALRKTNGNIVVDSNDIFDNDQAGILVLRCARNTITNNITHNNYRGIYVFTATDNLIANNIIDSNTYFALDLDETSDLNNISSNTISNNALHGISLRLSSNNFIKNNIIYNNGTNVASNYAGIRLVTSSIGNEISNNRVYNTGTQYYGIFQSGLTSINNFIYNNNCTSGGTNFGIKEESGTSKTGAGNFINDGSWSLIFDV